MKKLLLFCIYLIIGSSIIVIGFLSSSAVAAVALLIVGVGILIRGVYL